MSISETKEEATNKGIGGVAIAYPKELTESITDVQKIPHRIMHMALKTNARCKKIRIINSYAPHIGYGKEEQIQYWGEMGEILQHTDQKQCTIWMADNNGQIAKDPNDIGNNAMGPWAIANKTEPGNGQELQKICKKYALSATNTLYTT